MNKVELILSPEFQAFNDMQLFFATSSSSDVEMPPVEFYQALFLACEHSTFPSADKKYIAEKLCIAEVNSWDDVLDQLIKKPFIINNGQLSSVTPQYIVDGVLRGGF